MISGKSIQLCICLLAGLLAPVFGVSFAEDCPPIDAYEDNTEQPVSNSNIPYAKGLLWKIRNKAGNVSHIFGTIHLEDSRITELPAPVERILQDSTSFIMELVLDSEARDTYAESARLSDDSSLREQIDPELYERVAYVAAHSYGVSESILDRLKPWAVFTLLGRPRLKTGKVLDNVLAEQAALIDLPVTGLETADELVASLDSIPLQHQISILRETACNHAMLDEQVEKLTTLYLNRNLAGMVALSEHSDANDPAYNTLMQNILYQRNRRMVQRMQEQLNKGRAFIAVGALHLPGEEGILKLLEMRGFDVTPVY